MPDWVDKLIWSLICILLSVDSLRAVIAMLGIVPRNHRWKWLSRLVYGKYDRIVLYEALKDLGYPHRDSEVLIAGLQKSAPITRPASGVNQENVTMHVLAVLANYIQKYPRNIQYGGRTPSDSNYYIDTMEAVHNTDVRNIMADAMVTLISERFHDRKPDIIFTPKGGNPIFAKAVADTFGAKLVVVKPQNDKSRVTLSNPNPQEEFFLFESNYEGSWDITAHTDDQEQLGVVIDCNASGGSQLQEIACDLNRLIKKLAGTSYKLNIAKITDVFVLFRADTKHQDVDKKFKDLGLSIHRFFDLQETDKDALYQLHETHPYNNPVDVYSPADRMEVSSILNHLDTEKKLYWENK